MTSTKTRPRDAREARNRSGFTSLRITRATAALVREAIAVETKRLQRRGVSRWDLVPYRSRVDVSADVLIAKWAAAYLGPRRIRVLEQTHAHTSTATHTSEDPRAHTSGDRSTHTSSSSKRSAL